MDHARIISADDLRAFANKNASRGALPELLQHLIVSCCPDRTRCAIQDADHIDQPGVDGIVETATGYPPFLPMSTCREGDWGATCEIRCNGWLWRGVADKRHVLVMCSSGAGLVALASEGRHDCH